MTFSLYSGCFCKNEMLPQQMLNWGTAIAKVAQLFSNVAQQFNDHRPAIAKTAQLFSKVAQRFSDVVRLADE